MPRKTPANGHAPRRLTLGSGPLLRTSDRLEACARFLLGFVLLMGIALALAVGTGSYTQRQSEAATQAADRHRVSAELLEHASLPTTAASVNTADVGRAPVVWIAPSGSEHEAVISVPARARAGSDVLIWVDGNGDLTSPPLGDGDALTVAVGHALLSYLGISLVAVAAYRSFGKLLDRGRARRWAAEWDSVEPVWTGRVP